MNAVIQFLLLAITKLIHWTLRYEYQGQHYLEDAKKISKNKNYLLALWHQNLAGSIMAHSEKTHAVIVSPSQDGEYVAKVCKQFGLITCRGSSSREGQKALRQMIRIMKSGVPGAITVDGPKGPAGIVKEGIIELARLSGAPIVPLNVTISQYFEFKKSWDRFRLPKPFTKVTIYYGKPILITREIERDQFPELTKQIADKMNNLIKNRG